jgi:hypothetical protein
MKLPEFLPLREVPHPDLWPEIERRLERTDASPPPTRSFRRAGVVAVALLIAGAGIGLGIRALSRVAKPAGTASPALPGRLEGLPSGWSRLPSAPIGFSGSESVWTGTELIVWGGEGSAAGSQKTQGAEFVQAVGAWKALPAAPISTRGSAAAVWTGEEVLFWGGQAGSAYDDGAAYNPSSNSWRLLPKAPLTRRAPVAVVWTGTEMIVWGAESRSIPEADGAAYDPDANRWRSIATAPFKLNQASAVWTGTEMIVFGAELDAGGDSPSQGMAYDPRTDSWRVIADQDLSPNASSAVWTGKEMVVWDYLLAAAAYDPVSDSWRALPKLPLSERECYPKSAFAAGIVLAWYCDQAATLHAEIGRWKVLPTLGLEGGIPIAAGPVVLVVGVSESTGSTGVWAYRPPNQGP